MTRSRVSAALDIIVVAARQQDPGPILDVSSEDFDATMKTNIYTVLIIKAALLHLEKPVQRSLGRPQEQAYDPSPDLYDYSADQGGDDELCEVAGEAVRGLANPSEWRGSRTDLDAVTSLRGAPAWKSWRSSAVTRCSSAPDSRRSLPPSTCNWRHLTPVSRQARSMERREESASHKCFKDVVDFDSENHMAKKAKKRKYSRSSGKDVESEMRRYKKGTAKSGRGGKGGKVKSRKQAIAIGLSKARKKGKKVPKKKSR